MYTPVGKAVMSMVWMAALAQWFLLFYRLSRLSGLWLIAAFYR